VGQVGSVINRDGKWRAQVRRKGHAAQCRTFPTKAAADLWVRKREAEIDAGGVVAQASDLTVKKLIEAYRDLRDQARPISDSSNEHYMLKALERGFGSKLAARLTPDDFVAFATMRREEGAGPYTINMDVSKMGTVMRYGAAALRVSLPDAVGSARPLLTHLRLIGGGGKRERRPTEDELMRLLAYMHERHGAMYADAVAFGAISAMRRGEVCAFLLAEIDETTRVVPIWRKHPRTGKVLERVPLVGKSFAIAMSQPVSDDGRVFPIHPQTLSKYFKAACDALSITDLHFHDLRHEGTSTLFEQGYSIEQVALVTGHKSWNMLRRYTQLKPESIHQPPKKRAKRQPTR